LKRKKQRNFITESFAFLKKQKTPQNPNIWKCRGYPPFAPRALPEPVSFFEKKETKKLYYGKLRFPKKTKIATKPQHTGVQGVPLPVLRACDRNPTGGPGSTRRFWYFSRRKVHPPFL